MAYTVELMELLEEHKLAVIVAHIEPAVDKLVVGQIV